MDLSKQELKILYLYNFHIYHSTHDGLWLVLFRLLASYLFLSRIGFCF